MTLFFTDDRERLNINIENQEYNQDEYTGAPYVKISPEDMEFLTDACEKNELYYRPEWILEEGKKSDFTF